MAWPSRTLRQTKDFASSPTKGRGGRGGSPCRVKIRLYGAGTRAQSIPRAGLELHAPATSFDQGAPIMDPTRRDILAATAAATAVAAAPQVFAAPAAQGGRFYEKGKV